MSDRTTSTAGRDAQNRDQIATIVSTIDSQRLKYEGLLPTTIKWADFRNAFLIAVQSNWKLLEADRTSLFLALQKCAGAGLKPDGIEGALVIFGDDSEDEEGNRVPSNAKQKKKVVFLPMAWGLCKLMRNTGNVISIRAKPIYRGESVIISDENGVETYKHVRTIEEDSKIDERDENIIGAFAVVQYRDNSYDAEFMSRRQIDRARAVSRAKKGPWMNWYTQMAVKTPLRRLALRVEKSAENRRFMEAIEGDETMQTIEGDSPVEIMGAIRDEFTGGKTTQQQPKPAAPEDRQPPQRPAQDDAGRGRTPAAGQSAPRADEGAPGQPGAPRPEGEGAAGNAGIIGSGHVDQPEDPPTFEAWLVDAAGHEVAQEPHIDPVHFAREVEALCGDSNMADVLRNNAGALDDARDASEMARRIIDALYKASVAVDQPAGDLARWVVPVPKTPGGRAHGPNYVKAIRESLDRVHTIPEMEAWVEANQANWLALLPATQAAIGQAETQRREVIAPLEKRPVVDRDRIQADEILAGLAGVADMNALNAFGDRMDVKTLMARWERERPELANEVGTAERAIRAAPMVAAQ